MTSSQVKLIRESWKKVAALDPELVGGIFYKQLFELDPQLQPLFKSNIKEQSRKLLAMIGYVIAKLDTLDEIMHEVNKLAQRHVHYGVKESDYTVVGSALIYTLEKGLGKDWCPELEQAWTTCYGLLSGAMIQAAETKAA